MFWCNELHFIVEEVAQNYGAGKYKMVEKCDVVINFYNNLLTIGRLVNIIYDSGEGRIDYPGFFFFISKYSCEVEV